jgi:integrase
MKQKITKSAVDHLKPGGILADSNPVGFVARRLPSAAVTYGYRYRDKQSGRQRWIGLGLHGELTPDQARRKALRVAAEVRSGGEVASAAAVAKKRRVALGVNVDQLLDEFLARYVRNPERPLRGADHTERAFRAYVRPRIGAKSIYSVTRLDIVELLDAVEDTAGSVMADRTLAYLRKAFRWWAARDDQFSPPIVPGMARTRPKERARSRVLSDQEIRDVWKALATAKVPKHFPAFVRTLLLTCQRRDEVSRMGWQEVHGDVWEIPAERYKTGLPNAVPLTKAVCELLGAPKKAGFVFSSDGGKRALSGFSKAKRALDIAIAEIRKQEKREPMPGWRLHDLRRTGRSLMSRAGVPSDHAERTLGHVLQGVRGTYDRHDFLPEKKAALERLAALVGKILNPASGRVVHFSKAQ